MQLKGKKVLVYGAARSGISAVNLLQKLGARVLLFDCNTNLTKEAFHDKIDIKNGFTLLTGTMEDALVTSVELLILSPGVATDHPDIVRFREKSIPIWGEVELAYRYTKGKIIGITGTNGKTTTTTLVGEIMKSYFEEVFVVGNIGNSYSDAALATTDRSVTVIELSSFQLETIHTFKPDISVILNITPDHLDRHYTMENYIAMKERITMNQTMAELCIINQSDGILNQMSERLDTKVQFFSSHECLQNGLYLEKEHIVLVSDTKKQVICSTNELHLLGIHNYENVMAAAAIAIAMEVPMHLIRKSILDFRGVEHRIEYVETINGVTYYNDSKGTNPDATIRAVQAMRHPTVLIAGGYDKKITFDNLIEAFDDKVKYLILFGQTKEQIAETARRHGFTKILFTDSLQEAVRLSSETAVSGDVVLLSPACASWGMFENFEQRGRRFKEYVREML